LLYNLDTPASHQRQQVEADGIPAEDSVKWAEAEIKKVYSA
jgi:hypothetical protein